MYPENPEVGMTIRGKYFKPTCYYCYNSVNGKPSVSMLEVLAQLEELKAEMSTPAWSGKQWDKVQQLQGQVNYLQNKVKDSNINLLKNKRHILKDMTNVYKE